MRLSYCWRIDPQFMKALDRKRQRRILFVETAQEITVLAIVSRGQAYSKKALRAFGKRR